MPVMTSGIDPKQPWLVQVCIRPVCSSKVKNGAAGVDTQRGRKAQPVVTSECCVLWGRGKVVKVTFTPNHKGVYEHPRVYMTYLRSGQTSILSGENRSRDLHYDFIAGEVHTKPLDWRNDEWSATYTLSAPVGAEAVAVWVEDGDNAYIQSTGGFLAQ